MEPKELVTNKLLVWVSPLSFISKWLLKERNGTESNGTKRLGYKQITCLGISFISKWLLTEQNGSELNGTERKATCFYPYISSLAFLSIPLRSVSLFQIMIQKYFLTLSLCLHLRPAPLFQFATGITERAGYMTTKNKNRFSTNWLKCKRNGAERKAMEPKD